MSKKTLRWIVGLMTFSLLGLIGFQWYWADSLFRANEERFGIAVMEALSRVVEKLEKQETYYLINRQTAIAFGNSGGSSYPTNPASNGGLSVYYEFNDTSQLQSQFNLSITMDGQPVRHSDDMYVEMTEHIRQQQLQMEIELEEMAKFGNENIEELINRVQQKSNMVYTVLEEMIDPRAINHRISPEQLDSLLKGELSEKGIHIPYNFGIAEGTVSGIRFVSISDEKEGKNLIESPYQVNLFPNDLFGAPGVLAVNFPTKSHYLLRKLWLTMSSSGILLLVIIGCFAYAVHTIVRQKKLSEMKTDFINNMTHELKTPIATIGLATEALQDKAISQAENMRQRYVDVIGEENKRLGMQVEKVLQMAMMDKNELKMNIEVLAADEIIQKAYGKMAIQIENRKGSLKLALQAVQHQVKADPVHFLNVILNLLDNAIKYSSDEPNIIVRTQNTPGFLHVSIKDHGIGMSKEAMKNIFQQFYRVPTGNLHDVKGFGLGLSYVKNMVEEFGGKIEVESEINRGTIFTIKIPLAV